MGLNVTDMGLEKKAEGHELKKHAATIHCSNTLSLLQRKISNALLYHAYKELLVKEEHEITVKQLCKLIGYNGNNHSAIKTSLKGLLSTVIEWNVVSDTTGTEDWTASSILASVSLRGPICLYAYSPRMKELLHSPSMFGKINLIIQSRFKSNYGLALYENCIRYRGLPFTKWFDIETFRKLMGVPTGKYEIFRDFKRRVLTKSIEEVNTYSDLIIEPELHKEGHHVVKVRFSLKERAKKIRLGGKTKTALEEEGDYLSLKEKLEKQFSLSAEQVELVFLDYELEYILEKIALIEASPSYIQGKIQNIAGYLLSGLKNNYQQGKTSLNQIAKKNADQFHLQIQHQEASRLSEQMRDEYLTYREKLIDYQLAILPTSERTVFFEKFYRESSDAINTVLKLQRNKYTRDTVINSPQIQALLRHYAIQELASVKNQLVPIEVFIEKFPESHRLAWKQSQAFVENLASEAKEPSES